MSMILVGRRLTPEQLRNVVADPSVTDELLNLDDDEEADEPFELYLDKAWHCIHFLLTGTAWDIVDGAGEAVLGGDSVGEDNGYGPPRLLLPEKVRAVAAGLRDVDVDLLRGRYDPRTVSAAEIYPDIWDEDDVFDTYIAPYFVDLKAFFLSAADHNQAVLLALA